MSGKIVYALFITFAIFSFNSSALADSLLTGNYTVTVNWGDDGESVVTKHSLNSLQSDPLAYNANYSSESATASAAAGMWGNAENYGFSFWLTDGTGVGQNDPDHYLGKTTMTIKFDVTINDPDITDGLGYYQPWYDLNYLTGTVGGEGSSVSFQNESNLSVISLDGTETFVNSLRWIYENTTVGDFYVDSGLILPAPLHENEWFSNGDALHFYGTYTFMVDNDGGPSSINFTQNAPPPVPEPATMLLFGIGFVGLAGSKWRRKKK